MTEYVTATMQDRDEIIDFINYVFSNAHCPHDFKTLLPKSYADDAIDLGATHFLVKEDGKIKAVVALRVIDVIVGEYTLKYGLIGNVSVHPYSRGKGYMKALMQQAIDEAQLRGVDVMVLSGQRQRYGYFGFENAGMQPRFTVSASNVRHCFGEVDASDIHFHTIAKEESATAEMLRGLYEKEPIHSLRRAEELFNIMHTFNGRWHKICKGEEIIGYAYNRFEELMLTDERYFPAVLKAIFCEGGLGEAEIAVRPYQKYRMALLDDICERSRVEQSTKIRVLRWETVLQAFLNLQATLYSLTDGRVTVLIEDTALEIAVKNGAPNVTVCRAVGEDAVRLSNKEAVRRFFSLNAFWPNDARFRNWLPLPFAIDGPDTY